MVIIFSLGLCPLSLLKQLLCRDLSTKYYLGTIENYMDVLSMSLELHMCLLNTMPLKGCRHIEGNIISSSHGGQPYYEV